MSKIKIFILTVFLTGCATQPYDNMEYYLFVDLLTQLDDMDIACKTSTHTIKPQLKKLVRKTRTIAKYEEYYEKNDEVKQVSIILDNDAIEITNYYFDDKNGHNEIYCTTKVRLMKLKTEEIIKVIAKKRR